MLQILYYRNKCIGCNTCVEAAPYRWRMSKKDGKATLLQGVEKKSIFQTTVSLEEEYDNQIAAKNCPVKVIQLKVL
jgi:ferredoxin